MERFTLEATNKTPYVLLDPESGTLEVSGYSVHENAARFYEDLLDHIERYARTPAPKTSIRIFLRYFNSSSAKFLLDILRRLDELHATGASSVSLEWVHEAGDLDQEEAGNDYRHLLEMPVKVRAHPA